MPQKESKSNPDRWRKVPTAIRKSLFEFLFEPSRSARVAGRCLSFIFCAQYAAMLVRMYAGDSHWLTYLMPFMIGVAVVIGWQEPSGIEGIEVLVGLSRAPNTNPEVKSKANVGLN